MDEVAPADDLSRGSMDPVRAEIESFLEKDDSQLGYTYRESYVAGRSAEALAEESDTKRSTWVWSYTRIIRALLDRDLPTATSVARQVASRYRSILKSEWSPAARSRLEEDLAVLERRASDVDAIVEESEEAQRRTRDAEAQARVGIYVYALSHYIRFPFDPESGRTLLKVGRSDRDVIQRIREQTRTTALPEEPVLLRVYETGGLDTVEIERKVHETLRAFDHGRKVERVAGKEWFLTTTRAIDAVADLLNLDRTVVNDDADYLDDESPGGLI